MNKLLELEKKNQEYQFNYNCLSPLEKKEFLLWLGQFHGYNPNLDSDYSKTHDLFYKKIKQYYKQIKNPLINKDSLLEELFEIPANQVPDKFKKLTYQNSGLIEHQEYYLKQVFFNNEFNNYWDWITKEICSLTNYDISHIDNTIFRYAFLNCNKQKLTTDRTLESYYLAITNEEMLYSKHHHVSSNELKHIIFINWLATTLTSCEYSKFPLELKNNTKDIIVNLYHLFVPGSYSNIKKVA